MNNNFKTNNKKGKNIEQNVFVEYHFGTWYQSE